MPTGLLSGLPDFLFGTGSSPPEYEQYQFDPGASQSPWGDWWANQARGGYGQMTQGPRFGGGMDLRDQQAARTQQEQLMRDLQLQARGEGPSVAGEQMKSSMEQARANAASIAASSPGLGAGQAARQAQNAGERIGMQGARDASVLRAQEQLQAQQALGGLLGQMRGQDIGTAQAQAQLFQRDQMMKDQMTQAFMQAGMSQSEADRMAAMRLEAMKQQENQFAGQYAYNAYMGEEQANTILGAAGLSSAGGLLSSIATM